MPSLTSAAAWPIEAPFYAVAAAAILYWLGGRRPHAPPRTERTFAFALGLLSILVALDSPLDPLAKESFAAHMTQHVLLLAVAPPLLVLSAPWLRMWQPLPLRFRRAVTRALTPPVRSIARGLARPIPAWVLFNGTFVAWHVPALYDLTLRSRWVHGTEHALFLGTGLLFWGAVVDSPPFRAKLDWLARIVYVTTSMLVGWVLAVVLAFATSPLYPAYAALAHRAGGLSVMADQQLAAGVMWVPGSLASTIAVIVFFYRWLGPAPAERRRVGLASGG